MDGERERWFGSAWPVTALLLGFPLWWLLGLTSFVLILFAVPMAWRLARLPRIVVPPGFGWWLLFLAVVVASASMLGATAPDTVPGSFSGRLPGFALRLLNYLAATVVMLFVVNLPRSVISTRRLVIAHAWFFVVVVAGGLAGTFFPDVEIPSPLSLVIPGGNRYVDNLLTPSLAQVQGVLGFESPRPSAPFVFTNIWGNNLSLLLVWFVIATLVWGRGRVRLAGGVVLALSVVPIIYSLNRGLWLGLLTALLYVAVRAALRGKVTVMIGVAAATALVAVVVVLSPLSGVITSRLDNPHSNSARENTSAAAVTAALSSPVLGYGSTRAVVGSAQSLAVGRSPSCPQCGNAAIGGAGQMWLLLVAQGFTGLVLYVGFFLRTVLIYWRDPGPVAAGGVLVILLGLLYTPVYGAVGMPLALYMLAVALLWRQREDARAEATASAEQGVSLPRAAVPESPVRHPVPAPRRGQVRGE